MPAARIQVLRASPSTDFLSDPERELVDEAAGRGHDEDGVVEQHDVEVQPLDFAEGPQQVEVGDAWKEMGTAVDACGSYKHSVSLIWTKLGSCGAKKDPN